MKNSPASARNRGKCERHFGLTVTVLKQAVVKVVHLADGMSLGALGNGASATHIYHFFTLGMGKTLIDDGTR